MEGGLDRSRPARVAPKEDAKQGSPCCGTVAGIGLGAFHAGGFGCHGSGVAYPGASA